MNGIVLRKGDRVVMHTCMESKGENFGKIWTCRTDSFKNDAGNEVVFLDGFSGSFDTEFLQPVSVSVNGMTEDELVEKSMDYEMRGCGIHANQSIREAYVDGAKENGVFWHDLRKNPEDLPSSYHPVLNEHGEHVFYSKDSESWNRCEGNMRPCHVVAWCEVPRFVKEQG
jgi:hypothetical protein